MIELKPQVKAPNCLFRVLLLRWAIMVQEEEKHRHKVLWIDGQAFFRAVSYPTPLLDKDPGVPSSLLLERLHL